MRTRIASLEDVPTFIKLIPISIPIFSAKFNEPRHLNRSLPPRPSGISLIFAIALSPLQVNPTESFS